jgi:hypothetical protein
MEFTTLSSLLKFEIKHQTRKYYQLGYQEAAETHPRLDAYMKYDEYNGCNVLNGSLKFSK